MDAKINLHLAIWEILLGFVIFAFAIVPFFMYPVVAHQFFGMLIGVASMFFGFWDIFFKGDENLIRLMRLVSAGSVMFSAFLLFTLSMHGLVYLHTQSPVQGNYTTLDTLRAVGCATQMLSWFLMACGIIKLLLWFKDDEWRIPRKVKAWILMIVQRTEKYWRPVQQWIARRSRKRKQPLVEASPPPPPPQKKGWW